MPLSGGDAWDLSSSLLLSGVAAGDPEGEDTVPLLSFLTAGWCSGVTGGEGEFAGSGLAAWRPLEDFGLSSVESKNCKATPNRLLVKYSICMGYTLTSYMDNVHVPWFDSFDEPAFFAVVDFLGLDFGFGSSSSSDKRPANGSSSTNSVRYVQCSN